MHLIVKNKQNNNNNNDDDDDDDDVNFSLARGGGRGGGGGESLRSRRNFFDPLFLGFLDPPLTYLPIYKLKS